MLDDHTFSVPFTWVEKNASETHPLCQLPSRLSLFVSFKLLFFSVLSHYTDILVHDSYIYTVDAVGKNKGKNCWSTPLRPHTHMFMCVYVYPIGLTH